MDMIKLTFLNTVNDGKRLEVWNDTYKVCSATQIGKHLIDEFLRNRNKDIFQVINDICRVKTTGDLR